MKTFNSKLINVFLCAVFCVGWSTQDKVNISVQTPVVLELRQQAEKCGQETGVPASHLKKIIDKTLPNDKANNDFFYCVVFGTGLIDKDGHFMVDKMNTFTVVDGKQEDYANALKECNKISKDDAIQTLLAEADCIHKDYHFAPAAAKQK